MFSACKKSVISKMRITLFFRFNTVYDINVKMPDGTFCRVKALMCCVTFIPNLKKIHPSLPKK